MKSSDLLTERERELIRAAGQLYTDISAIVGNDVTRDDDLVELRFYIHGLQHALMAQAAARAYTNELRLLGALVENDPPEED